MQVLVLDGNRITHLPDWLGDMVKVRQATGRRRLSHPPCCQCSLCSASNQCYHEVACCMCYAP